MSKINKILLGKYLLKFIQNSIVIHASPLKTVNETKRLWGNGTPIDGEVIKDNWHSKGARYDEVG